LSQEITDILSNTDYSEVEKLNESRQATQEDNDDTKTPDQKAPDHAGKTVGYQEIAIQIGNNKKENGDENKGKLRGKPNQKADNVKQSVVIRKRATLEPDIDHDDQQLQFLDEVFGEQAHMEEAMDRATAAVKRDESRNVTTTIKKH
jgi:hypothetical protein